MAPARPRTECFTPPKGHCVRDCPCCGMWIVVPDESTVYAAQMSATLPGHVGHVDAVDGNWHPTGRVSRLVLIDAQSGEVLAAQGVLPADMLANLFETAPPLPIHAPAKGKLAAQRARAKPTELTEPTAIMEGWKTEVGRLELMEAIEHSANFAEVTANVPLRAGVRWTYHYSADELLPPRVVTHTAALAQVVATEAAGVRIATTGGPGFMPEWLLIDHGNVYVGTPDQASAWLHGQAVRPTQTAPYAVLPPPPGHVSWTDGDGAP